MMNIYQKLALATVGAALSFTAIESNSAEAAIVSRNFAVNDFVDKAGITEGPLASSYTGSFSYDDSLLTGSGAESIGISTLTFNFLGKTYTQSSDIDYPEFPKVRFLDGKFLGLNYAVTDPGNVAFAFFGNYEEYMIVSELPLPFYNPGAYRNSNLGNMPYVTDWRARGKVTYSSPTSISVPEPSAVVGLAVLGLGGLLLKKKATSSIA